MTRKTSIFILLILAVSAGLYACRSDAQTAPTWNANKITSGKTPVFTSVVGDVKLSMVQASEPSTWVGSFWGRDYAGNWTRISPKTGAAASDTSLTISSGSPFFKFPGIKLEVIVTTSGSATFWGE